MRDSSAASVGVVTNRSRRSAERMLAAVGLLPLVDTVVGADGGIRPKPSPEGIQAAMARLGATCSGAVFYVGDTVDDMCAAKAAGVRAIGVAYGVASADRLLAAGAPVTVNSFVDACVVGAASTGLALDISSR
jgi:phosphoglycolate phosphatase-like HAD superfamily hydrolase